ncbi:MAG: hypothetical protein AB1Z98_25035, partial [Nannocystaceae bacterium]
MGLQTPEDTPAWLIWLLAGLPSVVDDVDADALTVWVVHGIVLFAERSAPSLRDSKDAGRRAVASLAMHRTGGNLSRASRDTGTSRKVFREALRAAGLHPWPETSTQPRDRYRLGND